MHFFPLFIAIYAKVFSSSDFFVFGVKFWARLICVCVCLFWMQESAKAALKMKDCQMTDRTTQTEHMGPEVRYTQTTHTLSLSLSLCQAQTMHCALHFQH